MYTFPEKKILRVCHNFSNDWVDDADNAEGELKTYLLGRYDLE